MALTRFRVVFATQAYIFLRTLSAQRELKFKADTFLDEAWSRWSMHVHDEEGLELFSFPMADVKNGNGK